jgi:esterase/lipase
MPLADLAQKISTLIDTTEIFALVGVSMGGMLSVEINKILNPEKVIIISSAKNRKELPLRYRFQRAIPLYEILPRRIIYWGAKTFQPIVEPDRNTNKDTFKSMQVLQFINSIAYFTPLFPLYFTSTSLCTSVKILNRNYGYA